MPEPKITDALLAALVSGQAPAWASAWGEDGQGVFCDFTLDGVTQRLRWVPAGRFAMGSPTDEPGRWDAEGPVHLVTIATGFWLFDTPCTQALWQAVMGENPSHFQSPERPVEQVSWKEVQGFLARIAERIPDLRLSLPTEAQWERACRAGTDTALYTGPIEILGDANAPALDPIAWYGGNSAQGFELENGYAPDWLSDFQYPKGKAGTHPVKGKAPNAWGLHDMLGNVWEWVQDAWHDDYQGAPADGSAREGDSPGAFRVFRGGAWHGKARSCRCASRSRYSPDYRLDFLGFRCARVQEA